MKENGEDNGIQSVENKEKRSTKTFKGEKIARLKGNSIYQKRKKRRKYIINRLCKMETIYYRKSVNPKVRILVRLIIRKWLKRSKKW